LSLGFQKICGQVAQMAQIFSGMQLWSLSLVVYTFPLNRVVVLRHKSTTLPATCMHVLSLVMQDGYPNARHFSLIRDSVQFDVTLFYLADIIGYRDHRIHN
jgi:hypothetical protein